MVDIVIEQTKNASRNAAVFGKPTVIRTPGKGKYMTPSVMNARFTPMATPNGNGLFRQPTRGMPNSQFSALGGHVFWDIFDTEHSRKLHIY